VARVFTYLVVDAPDQPQQVILWDTIDVTVGRAPDRDVVLAHAEVSRQHAVFRLEGQRYTIADLHTSNGTFVNGARIASHGLRPGDVVEIGPARISFHQEPESPKGKHVRFASQLKGFAPGAAADNGRTVLGLGGPGAAPVAFDGADYADRLPSGEAQFDWDAEPGEAASDGAAVVDLDPLLDEPLAGVALASFEDEELTALDEKPEPPPRRAPAPPAPTRPPAPPGRAPAPAAGARPEPAPARAPARVARPPEPVRAVDPPTVRMEEPVRPAAAAPRAAAPAVAPAADETPARASLALELEGPRSALRAVVSALLDRELELGPLRVRIRRP